MKTVSVIIPYYNRPKKLDRCIRSVQNQSYKAIEIIVVDDASSLPPNALDDTIRYFRSDKNLGPGPSRNIGMQHATGTYISFLDCDDYWGPDFLETTHRLHLQFPDIVMAYSNGQLIDTNNQVLGIRRGKVFDSKTIIPTIFEEGRPWGTGGCLWKAEAVKLCSWQSFAAWEDYAFDTDVALSNNTIVGSPQLLVYYDASGADKISNLSNDTVKNGKNQAAAYILKQLSKSHLNEDEYIKKSAKRLLFSHCIEVAKNGNCTPETRKNLINLAQELCHLTTAFVVRILFRLPKKQQLQGFRFLRKSIT